MDVPNQKDLNLALILFGCSEEEREQILAGVKLFDDLFVTQNKFITPSGYA